MSARQGFIERSVADITATLEKNIFYDELARKDGFLQGLDPRVKVITFLALLLAVSLSKGLLIILALYLLTLLLAWRSRIPLGFFIKRVWLFTPFFTGLVALPALFNIFTPGEPIVTLWQSERFYLAITMQGLRTATFLVLRVGVSVSLALLSVLTTPWATLLKALRILHIPQAFILILGMAYRYIFLLLHTANSMFLARQSRTVGQMPGGENRHWIATSAGTLLAKSYHLSQGVYLAMLSRGFQGEAQILDTFRLKLSDWLWGATFLALAVLAVLI